MKRYLCPICDQELTVRRYCMTCRKVVKNPVVYDGILPNEDTGNYLLNHESIHPGKHCVEANKERICETPQEKRQEARFAQQSNTAQQRSTSSGTVYQPYRSQQSTAPGSQIWKTGTTNSSSSRNTYSGSHNTAGTKKGKKGCRSGCLTIFIIFWIIGILANVVSELDIESWIEENFEFMSEEPGRIEDYSGESAAADVVESVEVSWEYTWETLNYEDTWEEVDYEEILAAEERCNGNGHYHMSGADVYESLLEFVGTELGLELVDQYEDMYNNISHSEYGDYTYYSRYRCMEWDEGLVFVTCDSVTDEIHDISVYSYNEDLAIEIALKAFGMVEDEASVDTLRKSLYESLEGDDIQDGYLIDMGNSSVWITEESGEVTIDLWPITE